jgi:U3 small nucleolar RNA-associated protein 13
LLIRSYDAQKQTLLAVLGDQTILVFNANGASLSLQERLFGQHDEILDCAFLGPQDHYLAIAPNESEIRILDTRTSTCEVLPGHRDTVLCLDRNTTGEWLASGSKDHEARIWKLDFSDDEKVTSSCFAILKGHTGSVSAIALPRKTKDPSFVITGSDDRTVKCWDMSTGTTTTPFTPRSLYTQKAHDKDINGIDISIDDKLFATASQDRTIKIFSVENGEVVGILKGHRRGVFSAKFSATERILASGSGDGTVKLWSLSDFTCLKVVLPFAKLICRHSKDIQTPCIRLFLWQGLNNS